MLRASVAIGCALILSACGGSGIDSYEDVMNSSVEVMEDMITVLEGVDDEASAEKAADEIEALGDRLAEIAAAAKELPEPSEDEMLALVEDQKDNMMQFQERAMPQMMKMVQYPVLADAWGRAMEKMPQ